MSVRTYFEPRDVSLARWIWLQRCWGLFGIFLLLVTWHLWIPQQVFPQVPLWGIASGLPPAGQWAALTLVMVSLAAAVLPASRFGDALRPWQFAAFLVGMLVLVMTDQHRLQPWAYQLMLYAVVFGSLSSGPLQRKRGFALLRILTLSIYLYSSLGKFDFQFLHTVGQQFLEAAFGLVGLDISPWPWSVRLALAAVFPLVELLLVVALAWRRLRSLGIAAAVTVHIALLLLLGPFGLRHEPGVLLWNQFFIVQVLMLFSEGRKHDALACADEPNDASGTLPSRWVATCVITAAVCLPLLEPVGWWDHWPSWGLYSPRNSRAVVEVHRAGLGRLPAELQPYLGRSDGDATWVALEIDKWSLDVLSVPIYPQDRFQLGVAEAVAKRYGLDRTIRVQLLGMSNRYTGKRKTDLLSGSQQIVAAADRFRFNAHPTRDWSQGGRKE